jgi:hypothetical protein
MRSHTKMVTSFAQHVFEVYSCYVDQFFVPFYY